MYAPHTLPEGWWNFKCSRADIGRRCRVPRRVSPYDEGSWGRCLDVRANQLSQFPAYVAGRATTARTGPEGAVPVARGLPGSRPPPSQAVVTPSSKGSVREALPEGAFSEAALASRFLPAYRDTVNPLGPASLPEELRQPVTYPCGGTEGLRVSQPGTSHLSGLFRDSNPSPLPDYEPGVRGGSEVHSVTRSMSGWFSCPGPARPCSEFQLVLAILGLILFPRQRRPLRPSRACRASQLTGYLIASG